MNELGVPGFTTVVFVPSVGEGGLDAWGQVLDAAESWREPEHPPISARSKARTVTKYRPDVTKYRPVEGSLRPLSKAWGSVFLAHRCRNYHHIW